MDTKRAFEGIAVVGMSGRVPGAANLDQFWNNLANGVESSTVFPDEEVAETLRRLNFDPALRKHPRYVNAGFVLDGVELFDPAFFGLSSREAALMDPQHRLFLECAWEALENAGCVPGPVSPRIGVFGGCLISQYLMVNLYHHVDVSSATNPLQNLISNDKDYLATRISYLLDLKGPSITVQTACSTSLVAVCIACDSLRDFQCDLALAGGVTVMVPPIGYYYDEGNIYSPDGHCRPFDAKAAGTVFGAGAGMVVLKRLEDALADGDTIHAVIKDAAVNNDGNRKVGYTAPNELAQAEVIATAQARAEIDAETITYVEAHGTATQLGDPIEVAALTRAFRRTTQKKGFCAIGSVKSNIGHSQAAAGVASLIKTVLALKHRMLPPSLHFTKPNPAIDFANSPFYVNTVLRPWDAEGPLRAGVSSFGMGGTNAHVILEEAPPMRAPAAERRGHYVLPLSARSDAALHELAKRYDARLAEAPDLVPDICFTAAAGRTHFDRRLAVVGSDARSLREQLSALQRNDIAPESEWHERLLGIARDYERGDRVDWMALGRGRRVPLPTYPFERQRCWIEPAAAPSPRAEKALHPLLGRALPTPESGVMRFEATAMPQFLESHVIAGSAVVPAAALWEMALAAGEHAFGALPILEHGALHEPLLLDGRRVHTELKRVDESTFIFRVHSLADSLTRGWRQHAEATLRRGDARGEPIDLAALRASMAEEVDVDALYRSWRERGSEHGVAFQSMSELRRGAAGALACVRLAEELRSDAHQYHFHPSLLDGCLHVAAMALGDGTANGVVVPAALARLGVTRKAGAAVWVHARPAAAGSSADVDVYDDAGQHLAELRDVRFATVSARAWQTNLESDCYEIAWRPKSHAADASPQRPAHWLLFMDRGETGAALANLLEARGHSCTRVQPGDVDPADVLAHHRGAAILDLRALDGADDAVGSCGELLRLIRALASAEQQPASRLWIVTRETQPVAHEFVRSPAAAALWGLARTAAHEHPELGCVCIDLGSDPSDVESLAAELQHRDGEDQIAYRRGTRYVARIARMPQQRLTRPPGPFHLAVRNAGSLESLALAPMTRRAPAAHEIEFEVRAAGINFKDVLAALGRIGPIPLGFECAGVVCAAGSEVRDLVPGDPVMAIAPHSISSHITIPATSVARIPDNLGFAEAATLPVAYATAFHALTKLAKVQAGETVLIHAAAGGVGVAAVRLARSAGATIFATASTPKWDFVRSMGVEHVMSSRTLDFADEVARLTGGRGVDVVINSLGSPFLEKSVEILARNGRFVELGKVDRADAARIRNDRPDAQYFVLDIGADISADPAVAAEALALVHDCDPIPYCRFPVEDAEAAFRYVAQGRHIGKVVLSVDAEETIEVRAGATYLITGGFGALGRQVARRLRDRGATHLVLIGRGVDGDFVQELERDGVHVAAVQSDIAAPDAVDRIERVLRSGWPPLRGVIHAAGVLDDGIVLQQSPERFAAVMAPKVAGAWSLHALTRHRQLDFFVLFSSISSVAGAPGQSSYAAANAFLDAFAHYRRGLGLPALSINWGPWSGSGMAARNASPARLASLGIRMIDAAPALDLMERLARREASQVVVFPVEWNAFRSSLGDSTALLEEVAQRATHAKGGAMFLQQLRGAPHKDRRDLLRAYLRAQVARVLGLPSPDSVEPSQKLFDIGLDSLTALELRNLLESGLGAPLRATLLFDCGSVAELETHLATHVLASELEAPAPPAPADARIPVARAPERAMTTPASTTSAASPEPIAVIGIGCRFPGGVDSPASYWKLLCGAVDAITEVPPYRWDVDRVYDPNPAAPEKIYSRSGGFLGPVDAFDAEFFGILPREAATLDPQQRLLLETSWEALEHAHLPPDRLFGSDAGVFVGISALDYATILRHYSDSKKADAYYGTGNAMSGAVGRISYTYGLKGPCMAVETACSSSLVAVHLACSSLAGGECSIALAGGVNLLLAPDNSIVFSRARMLAPDGRCKTFSDAADGYGRGEGCGVVVLERLSDALKNRRRILGVIRGTAVNQDGASGGLTVPNGPSQQMVVRQALQRGGVEPARVSYVEAHGTGTALGDPIEVNALAAVFGKHRSKADPLVIGSVKSNIGHLESAAGIAGVIKLALCLQHGQLPASLHFDRPNRNIAWDELPVRVATSLQPWSSNGHPRVGGVSSFGFAGTNAHVVMEEPPPMRDEAPEPELPFRLLTLSAKTPPALDELARAYERFFATCSPADFANACNGANTGRMHFKHRLSVVASSPAEASRLLSEFGAGRSAPAIASGKASSTAKIAFLCTGQGSQYSGMGRQLYHTQPVFRAELDRCAAILAPLLERPLLDVTFGDDAGGLLDQTAYTQPVLFAFEYALAKQWESWGIRPAALIGHSIGEYAAACLAGIFSVEDALQLVAMRGRLMQRLPAGGVMVAVFADEARVRAALRGAEDAASIAAVNGPQHVVVSGSGDVVEAALAPLAAEGVRLEKLKVSHAFHSPLMDPILEEFRRTAARLRYSEPRIPLVSNVSGEFASGAASPDYWVEHLRQTVKFDAGMRTLHQKGSRVFLELGPQPILLGMARAVLGGDDCVFVPSQRRGREALEQLFSAAGSVYVAGAAIDWEAFERVAARPRVVLPTYPFQKTRHWFSESGATASAASPKRETRTSKVSGLLDRGNSRELLRLIESSLSDIDRSTLERVVHCLIEQHVEELPAGDVYQLEWRAADLEEAATPRSGSCLILGDGSGIGEALARQLRASGRPCTAAEVIDAFQPADFARLVAHADSPQDIIYLWGLDAQERAGLVGLLHLVKALASGVPAELRVWIVTRNAVAATPGPIDLGQAPLWGLGRVIAVEHSELWGGLIDLDHDATAETCAEWIRAICNGASRGEQIALRGGRRLAARLARADALQHRDVEIRSDAAYLLAGGLGALGLALAKWMASQGARHLILTSRGGPTANTLPQIQELEAMGVRVVAVAADAASETDMARVFAEAAASLPPVRGIVHLAGVIDDGILLQQTPERFERVMAPKVRGAWTLHQLSAGLPLDFFVLFSSTAALLGSPGQGNYAAANAYLDALAAHRRASELPALSINWGPWAELGMAASLGHAYRERLENQGVRLLEPAQAFRTFGTLLRSTASHAAVMPVDWSVLKHRFPRGAEPPVLADFIGHDPADEQAGRYARELRMAPPGERASMLATYLQERLAAVMGLPAPQLPPVDQGFAEMGMDSLMILELKTRIELDLGISFSAALVFNYPTVSSLGVRLCEELGLSDELVAAPAEAPVVEEDLAALEAIRNSSDDELAALIAREFEAQQ